MKKLKIFHRIMKTTHMYEMLAGFLVYYFITAIVIWAVDPSITKFSDSLWLCFATSTTVGFGDVTATSLVSRILTVILTLYGILVTAFIPAVVVNYFMEFQRVKANDTMDQFFDKLENLDTLSKEELKAISDEVKKTRK